ncbi:MAG: DUF7344 domain-containing protein [Natronomonas sp.]
MEMDITQLVATYSAKTNTRGESGGGESGTTGGETSSEGDSLDVVFDVLSSSRRRLVLRRLEARDGESTINDLAEHIAAVENDKAVSELSSQERKRVYVSLYQAHLPRMEEVGVVSLDDGTVTVGPNADRVYAHLSQSSEPESTGPPIAYVVHTALSIVALVVGFVWFESLLPFLFALSLSVYAVLAGWQFLTAERR